ncbi:MAG: hypothetical protein UX86_C0025G0005 [Candidatus Amesbacteria bacterium GW2011_GWC1_47_15]|uniref:Uncharacterized protein n=3 Tax=Candidatus Amesiibacteriota TaxID=1752730 RepID=A0A0G1S244_9BACT|nr:MAG: hypothetical protein UX86_C0025G0005 [Candidatus Amesbacteria bacterium GW2011_GWC1_47_15]
MGKYRYNDNMGEPLNEASEPAYDRQIENFRRTIPNPDRRAAIEQASRKREEFLLKVWREERSKLPADLITKHSLEKGLDGWNKYLHLGFEQDEYRNRFGFEDWSAKFLAQMLRAVGDDKEILEKYGRKWYQEHRHVKNSFYEHYFVKSSGVDPEIWWGRIAQFDPDSMLAHSVSREALKKIIKSGVIGRSAYSTVAMCRDRIVYDSGYVIIFQAKDLQAAGYPLLSIGEDPRDAKILREVRTPMPIDIRLARYIALTSEIPDRHNASKAQIAYSYFGEEYLRDLQRI